MVLTALFVFAVLTATSKTANAATAGIVIGLSLSQVWLFIVEPLASGELGTEGARGRRP